VLHFARVVGVFGVFLEDQLRRADVRNGGGAGGGRRGGHIATLRRVVSVAVLEVGSGSGLDDDVDLAKRAVGPPVARIVSEHVAFLERFEDGDGLRNAVLGDGKVGGCESLDWRAAGVRNLHAGHDERGFGADVGAGRQRAGGLGRGDQPQRSERENEGGAGD
jgi:hypothetical protein